MDAHNCLISWWWWWSILLLSFQLSLISFTWTTVAGSTIESHILNQQEQQLQQLQNDQQHDIHPLTHSSIPDDETNIPSERESESESDRILEQVDDTNEEGNKVQEAEVPGLEVFEKEQDDKEDTTRRNVSDENGPEQRTAENQMGIADERHVIHGDDLVHTDGTNDGLPVEMEHSVETRNDDSGEVMEEEEHSATAETSVPYEVANEQVITPDKFEEQPDVLFGETAQQDATSTPTTTEEYKGPSTSTVMEDENEEIVIVEDDESSFRESTISEEGDTVENSRHEFMSSLNQPQEKEETTGPEDLNTANGDNDGDGRDSNADLYKVPSSSRSHSANLEDTEKSSETLKFGYDSAETVGPNESSIAKEESTATTATAAPEGSMASFFEKINAAQGSEKHASSTSFEALLNLQQQQQIDNEAEPGRSKPLPLLLGHDDEKYQNYFGFPWGVDHGGADSSRRRIPDMDLLYLVFRERMNMDQDFYNFYKRPQPEHRFPLSMGQEQQDLPDDDITNGKEEPEVIEEQISKLMKVSDAAVDKLLKVVQEESERDNNNSDKKEEQDQLRILEEYLLRAAAEDSAEGRSKSKDEDDDLVQGLDDIDKFFQRVDPPDELDVGAASGSSMQELIMGKGREILVKRVLMGYKFVRKICYQILKHRQLRQKEDPSQHNAVEKEHSNNFLRRLLTDFDWRGTANSIMDGAGKLYKSFVSFVDDVLDGDEPQKDSTIDDTLDLDAIRKMSGLKL